MMGASMKDWDKETDGEDNIGQDGKIKQESRSDSDWWIWKHVYFGQIGILFIQSDLFCKSNDLLKVEKKHTLFLYQPLFNSPEILWCFLTNYA